MDKMDKTLESLRLTAANPHVSKRIRGVAAGLARDVELGRVTATWASKLLLTSLMLEAGVQ